MLDTGMQDAEVDERVTRVEMTAYVDEDDRDAGVARLVMSTIERALDMHAIRCDGNYKLDVSVRWTRRETKVTVEVPEATYRFDMDGAC